MDKEEKLAIRLRERWNVDFHIPIDIFSLVLEKINNLTLMWYDMDESISGCCSKNNKDNLILINSNHTKGRQNFTLAHEVYHLLFDDEKGYFCSVNLNNKNEIKANNFASYLLLPSCGLEKYIEMNNIEKWDMNNIIKCEQIFQISHHAMLVRLKKEKYITEKEFEEFKKDVKINAIDLGFDTILYEKSPNNKKFYTIGELIPLIKKSYLNDKISKGLMEEILIKNYRSDIVYNLKEDSNFD